MSFLKWQKCKFILHYNWHLVLAEILERLSLQDGPQTEWHYNWIRTIHPTHGAQFWIFVGEDKSKILENGSFLPGEDKSH